MKHIPTLLFATLALTACGSEDAGGSADGGTTADDTPLEEVEVDVPSLEEATEEAAAEIDEANADAEFEKLKAEIEGGEGN